MKEGGYKRLKERCYDWIHKARWPMRQRVSSWPKSSLGSDLTPLYHKLILAQQLGWEGRVIATAEGLYFEVTKQSGEFEL